MSPFFILIFLHIFYFYFYFLHIFLCILPCFRPPVTVYAGVGKERAGALQQLYADIDDYGQSIKAMTD